MNNEDIKQDELIAVGNYTMEELQKWKDPDIDITSILETAYDTKDPLAYIEEVYPGWVTAVGDKFAPELSLLDKSWERMCKKLKTRKQKIVLVSIVILKDPQKEYRLVSHFGEVLTVRGYCVRSVKDLTLCETCNECMPNRNNKCVYCRIEGIEK